MLQCPSPRPFPVAIRKHLDPNGVPDATHELEMRAVHLARALPAPQEVTAAVVPANPRGYDCSEGGQTQLRARASQMLTGRAPDKAGCFLWCTNLEVGLTGKTVGAQRRLGAQPVHQRRKLC